MHGYTLERACSHRIHTLVTFWPRLALGLSQVVHVCVGALCLSFFHVSARLLAESQPVQTL
jgi:hypothetical protein